MFKIKFKQEFLKKYSRVRNKRTPLNKHSPWNIWQKQLNKSIPLLNSREFDSFILSQRKRNLKILKKVFKNQNQ